FMGIIDVPSGIIANIGPTVSGLDAIAIQGISGISLTNTATVFGGSEVNTSNNTATDVTAIDLPQDLSISKTHTGNFAQGQTGASYTIDVQNIGGVSTSGTVTVTDALPAGLTATAISGTGWSCI